MAGPTLGTLLIQRLDAALGTTLSAQSSIVNRATSDAIAQPGQPDRLEPVSNTLIRHPRETVDRLISGAGSGHGIKTHKPSTDRSATAGQTPHSSPTTSTTTTLGPAARIILALFATHTGASPPVAGRTPLLPTAPSVGTHADQLAQALTRRLTRALQQSGLFYESHLKDVSRGQYPLIDAQQEPQAKAASHARAGAAASRTSTVGAGPTASGSAIAHTATTPGVDPATHGIVRQQLEALADQTVHWRGEAWPGAGMDWQVRRQPEHADTSASNADTDASWQSRIQILLPGLGDVTADVRLLGKQIYLTLQADDATARLMRHHASELYRQMSDRRLELTAVHFIDPDQPES